MMTHEQFVFWISGYLTAFKDNDANVIVEDIKRALKGVIAEPSKIISIFPSEY